MKKIISSLLLTSSILLVILTLMPIQQAFAVTITCSTGGEGTCYEDTTITINDGGTTYSYAGCEAAGDPDDYCELE